MSGVNFAGDFIDKPPFFAKTLATDSARSEEKIDVRGFKFLYVERSSTATNVRVRFGDENGPQLTLQNADTLRIEDGVRYIYVTHTAQAGAYITLILSIDNEIVPATGNVTSITTLDTLTTITNPVKVINDTGTNLRVRGINSGLAADLVEVSTIAARPVHIQGVAGAQAVTIIGNQGSSSNAAKVYSVSSDPVFTQQNSTGGYVIRGQHFPPVIGVSQMQGATITMVASNTPVTIVSVPNGSIFQLHDLKMVTPTGLAPLGLIVAGTNILTKALLFHGTSGYIDNVNGAPTQHVRLPWPVAFRNNRGAAADFQLWNHTSAAGWAGQQVEVTYSID